MGTPIPYDGVSNARSKALAIMERVNPRVPFSRKKQNLAWHYTSAQGLISILTSHTLRATSAAFMNDANEMKTGIRALNATFERIKDSLPPAEREAIENGRDLSEGLVDHLYLLSASEDPDLLTLWRNYGGATTPYAIGLDLAVSLRPVEVVRGSRHPDPPNDWVVEWEETNDGPVRTYDPDDVWIFGGEWNSVKYVSAKGGDTHETAVREMAKSALKAQQSKKNFIQLPAFADSDLYLEKDRSFKDEAEIRIVVQANPAWKFVQFRESRFGVVPFIELSDSAEHGDYVSADSARKLPIREVWVGPTSDTVTARRALENILNVTGYGDVGVRATTTPYR